MKQINSYLYEVSSGEMVTIVVTPKNGADGRRVAGAVDGTPLTNTGSAAIPKFEFEVTKPIGKRHRVVMIYGFAALDPANAAFEPTFSGSAGGVFPGNPVTNNGKGPQSRDYTFKVL